MFIYAMIYPLYGSPLMLTTIIRLVIEWRKDEIKEMKLRLTLTKISDQKISCLLDKKWIYRIDT